MIWTDNKIRVTGARMISELLKTNTTLTKLNLTSDKNIIYFIYKEWNDMICTANNIGESGARMISESLKTNTTLTELNLSSDEIGKILVRQKENGRGNGKIWTRRCL